MPWTLRPSRGHASPWGLLLWEMQPDFPEATRDGPPPSRGSLCAQIGLLCWTLTLLPGMLAPGGFSPAPADAAGSPSPWTGPADQVGCHSALGTGRIWGTSDEESDVPLPLGTRGPHEEGTLRQREKPTRLGAECPALGSPPPAPGMASRVPHDMVRGREPDSGATGFCWVNPHGSPSRPRAASVSHGKSTH